MEDNSISALIRKVENESALLSGEYSQYPPIFNSKEMLKEIGNIIKARNFELSEEDLDQINIGLLAAKALDAYNNFKNYAISLHNLWGAFLTFLHCPFQIPISGPEKRAYEFYESHFLNPTQAQIMDHLYCIDFRNPVNIIELKIDYIVAQWRGHTEQGDYYGELDKSPSCLGIYRKHQDSLGTIYNRKEHRHCLSNNVHVLESIAKSVLDTWSIKGKKYPTRGGCIQYFNKKNKGDFHEI